MLSIKAYKVHKMPKPKFFNNGGIFHLERPEIFKQHT